MKLREIFTAALQQPTPGERAAFLDSACGADAALRARVEALLAEQDNLGNFLEAPAAGQRVTAVTQDSFQQELTGCQIGPYRLLQQIGEGGMGVVFLAEQIEPVRRRVALKIIKPGMDTRQVIARFEAERQALALMDHPHIARVFDAGTTHAEGGWLQMGSGRPEVGDGTVPSATASSGAELEPPRLPTPASNPSPATGGRPLPASGLQPGSLPYFVMELVPGLPITEYCDAKQLTLRERLELFLPVCQAIQHAHQKGIIHRDIKPSNVLVTEYEQQAVPKVIDFGVAKAINQPLTERAELTGFGQVVGTVEYMSPEQAKLNELDIDTRSDVYALGVMLYELLTGLTPFDKAHLRSAAWNEVLRIIREEDPPTPSTRLSSSDALPSMAAIRRMEPRILTGQLRRELDWVVMKAMEKDRARRYHSAAAMADDVRRYLDNEPIIARPPTAAYRLRKFAVRHAALLTALGAVSCALSIGLVAATWQAFRATRAERFAERQLGLAEGRYQIAWEAVDTFLNHVAQDEQLKSAPLHPLREKLLTSAIPFYQRLADERVENGRQEAARADAWLRLGRVHDELGDYPAALADFDQARTGFQDLTAREPATVEYQAGLAGSHENRAWVFRKLGQTEAARAALQAALEGWDRLSEQSPVAPQLRLDQARAFNSLGNLLKDLGQDDAAFQTYEQVCDTCEQLAVEMPDDPRRVETQGNACNNLGLLWRRRGQRAQARACFDQALDCFGRLTGQSPHAPQYQLTLAQIQRNRGNVLQEMGDQPEARAAFLASLATHQQLAQTFPLISDYRRGLAASHNDFGLYLQGLDELELAVEQFESAIGEFESLRDDLQARVGLARAVHNLAWAQRRRQKYDIAREQFTKAIDLRTQLAAAHPDLPARQDELAQSWNDLGVTLADLHEWDAARRAYEQAIAARRKLLTSSNNPAYRISLAGTCCNLGNLETEQPAPEACLPWFQQAQELLEGVLAEVDVDRTATLYLRNALWSRAEVLEKLGRHNAAVVDWTRATDLTPAEKRQPFRRSLALALAQAGRYVEAAAAAESLIGADQITPVDLMTAAIVFALCSADATDDATQRDRFGQRAVALIDQAHAGGLFAKAADVDQLKTHPGLAALRERADFQQLLERLEKEVGRQPLPPTAD